MHPIRLSTRFFNYVQVGTERTLSGFRCCLVRKKRKSRGVIGLPLGPFFRSGVTAEAGFEEGGQNRLCHNGSVGENSLHSRLQILCFRYYDLTAGGHLGSMSAIKA